MVTIQVLKELAHIVFADMKDFIEVDEGGKDEEVFFRGFVPGGSFLRCLLGIVQGKVFSEIEKGVGNNT
jgi:hypothetical protein